MNRWKRWLLTLPPAAVLALGALPNSVVMHFARYQGDRYDQFYSFYSLMPLGYGNCGPMLTMVLSAILLLACLWNVIKPSRPRLRMTALLALVALLASLLNLLFQEMTPIGWIISLLLALLMGLSAWFSKT